MATVTVLSDVNDARCQPAARDAGPVPAAVRELEEDVRLAAECDVPVLICGGSTSQAEQLALTIHRRSPRQNGPFVVLDAALRELQAALFDSIRALLRTDQDASDLLRRARGGTLFIPHIEEMSPAMQVALLHFLELPEMRGDASVRMMAAADDLAFERVQSGRFREELYYRLNVIRIALPAATLARAV